MLQLVHCSESHRPASDFSIPVMLLTFARNRIHEHSHQGRRGECIHGRRGGSGLRNADERVEFEGMTRKKKRALPERAEPKSTRV